MMMTTTCLINNFNYARYVGEAIDGALCQTVPFDEIIVVDDGSTDGSPELLAHRYADEPRVRIVCQANQGQLSCFNEGFRRARGDVVFFLDADDVYEPDYVERVLEIYSRQASCDFVFCAKRMFGQQHGVSLAFPRDRDLGYSVVRTALGHDWIGAATSCLSMRREVLQHILPLPFVDDWRVRADDCLVFGASLVGARKRFLAQPLVRCRIHGQNLFRGRKHDPIASYRRRLAITRLFAHLEQKTGYAPVRLSDFLHREFDTIEQPTIAELLRYVRLGFHAPVSFRRRLAIIASMTQHYLVASIVGRREGQHAPSPPTNVAGGEPAHLPATEQRRAA